MDAQALIVRQDAQSGESEVTNALKIAAAAALLTAAAACASTGGGPAPEPHFFVTRHLQKDAGQDPGLTAEGQRCAQALAVMLEGRGVRAIFASMTRRGRETAAYPGNALRVMAQEYAPADIAGVAARAQAAEGSVLIVGHSNTVPDIVERLGGTRPGPIDESRYAEVWQIARSGGATQMVRIPGC